jgi:hypothetical protein
MFHGYVTNVKEWKMLLIHIAITKMLLLCNEIIIHSLIQLSNKNDIYKAIFNTIEHHLSKP